MQNKASIPTFTLKTILKAKFIPLLKSLHFKDSEIKSSSF